MRYLKTYECGMRYLKTYEQLSGITFKLEKTDRQYTGCKDKALKVTILENDEYRGHATITIRDNVFTRWEAFDDEVVDDTKIDYSAQCMYIIGISTSGSSNRGFGTQLLNYIEDYARENNCKYVALSSVTKAIGFWRKKGYTVFSMGGYYSMYKLI